MGQWDVSTRRRVNVSAATRSYDPALRQELEEERVNAVLAFDELLLLHQDQRNSPGVAHGALTTVTSVSKSRVLFPSLRSVVHSNFFTRFSLALFTPTRLVHTDNLDNIHHSPGEFFPDLSSRSPLVATIPRHDSSSPCSLLFLSRSFLHRRFPPIHRSRMQRILEPPRRLITKLFGRRNDDDNKPTMHD